MPHIFARSASRTAMCPMSNVDSTLAIITNPASSHRASSTSMDFMQPPATANATCDSNRVPMAANMAWSLPAYAGAGSRRTCASTALRNASTSTHPDVLLNAAAKSLQSENTQHGHASGKQSNKVGQPRTHTTSLGDSSTGSSLFRMI
jgi:hypothetical protein